MLSTLPSSEPSTDFVCPLCGVSAFEIVAEPPEENGYSDRGPSLFMRCFGCHHVYQHQLEDVRAAMAGTVD
jgi:rubredoxin